VNPPVAETLAWTPAVEGRIREAVLAPAAVLSEPCAPVDPLDPEVERLAADLLATMRANAGCVGLAANQIGTGARVFVVDVGTHPKTRTSHGCLVLCNAEVVAASRWQKAREGCLSVPAFTGDVKRAGLLTVRGFVPGRAEPVELTTDAFEARALQHEIDHTDGRLFLDRVAGAHAVFPRKTYL
jgi:peptide deformylase